ncbi:MAG: glycosyltransferase family 9 protein [Bdellovibrionales bacterium]
MKILFITSSRIGDAVLSSGVLNHIEQTYPQAKVTIACGPLAVSLFQGYPLLETIIPLKKEKRNGHWVKLWQNVVGTRWDIVIDLRDSAVSRLILAKHKFIFSRHIEKEQHKAKQCADVLRLDGVPSPKMWFTKDQLTGAQKIVPSGGAVLGVGPTANWVGKTWPAERFIEVVSFMIQKGGVMDGARVAVFGAPGEEEDAQKVLAAIPEAQQINCIAKGTPGEAAAMIARCDFYIGNDSGLMHCAAAAGVPTIGLFGPSYPHIYAPFGDHTSYIRTPETFDELTDYEGYSSRTCGCLMQTLSVDAVCEEITKRFTKAEAA